MDFDPTATPSNLPRIANAILDIILDSQGNYKFLYITSDEKESNGEEITRCSCGIKIHLS